MIRNLLIKKLKCRLIPLMSGMLALLLTSCDPDPVTQVISSGLGAEKKEYVVGAEEGSLEIMVYANHYTDISFAGETDWAMLLTDHIDGDAVFTIAYDKNNSFRRMAKIYLCSPESGRRDSVYLKQEGTLVPKIAFKEPNTNILSAGGVLQTEMETNIERSLLNIQVTYTNEEDIREWIENDFAVENGIFSFTVNRNASETEVRNARISISFTDGWDEVVSSDLYLMQANAQDLFGIEASFAEIHTWAGAPVITDGIYLEGYVVSNRDSKNVTDNVRTSETKIDYTPNDKTVCIESLDGKYGFKIVTATAADNIFNYRSKVQLLLKGTTVVMEENPNRYTITNVKSNMLVFSTDASSQIPVKEKYMGELTDDDIYTYVTLKECEFPVRKGSMTPVHEGYGPLFSQHRITKYPLLIRDIEGNSMYMLTNMLCPYRRDGHKLPYGSGMLSGLIVHETYTDFEYEDTNDEDTYGQIGRYQIRHTRYEDINMTDNFSYGFSALLTEYRYPKRANGNKECRPTTGSNGKMTVSVSGTFAVGADYSYLGPCGEDQLGDRFSGNGGTGIDEDKSYESSKTNTDGNGSTSSSAWGVTAQWWNNAHNRGEAFVIEFSTAGIQTTHLSMQMGVLNQISAAQYGADGAAAPRFWKAEWSEHGNMDGQWNPIDSFTVPDSQYWSNTQRFQSPGYKYIDLPLPLTMLGKDKVYIRLVTERNVGSDGYKYANIPLLSGRSSRLNYFAVRYNK
jgi:hypothetical protein